MSLPAVSKHLRVLTDAGLIERHTEAQWRRCTLRGEGLRAAADWMEFYRRFWEAQLDRLDAFLQRTAPDPVPSPAKESAMSAVVDDRTLKITRLFDAPPERVFDAWAKQDQFVQWMCPPGVIIDECVIDVRPGGAWRIKGRSTRGLCFVRHVSRGEAAGADRLHLGASSRRRLQPAAGPRDHGPHRAPSPTATRPSWCLLHGPFEDVPAFENHRSGWTGSFDKLETFLGRPS